MPRTAAESARSFAPSRPMRLRLLLLVALLGGSQAGSPCLAATSHISAVWANDGEDKVTQEETRATTNPNDPSVLNSVFRDGHTITPFGGRNEVVAFNLVLEAGTTSASNVSVALGNLTGPGGAVIRSVPRPTGNLFNWTGTEAELFFVRYLPITGMSAFLEQEVNAGGNWFSNNLMSPAKLRMPGAYPWDTVGWTDRPNHDRHYPDIAVPLELVPTFPIAAPGNQSVWVDIYIPKNATPGQYAGNFTISEGGVVTQTLPVLLTVHKFTLPDVPNSKTMIYIDYDDVGLRYTGAHSINPGTPEDAATLAALRNHRMLAHRHKLALIEENVLSGSVDKPSPGQIPFLNGNLFTAANGYAGPGVATGNGVHAIGPYGSWQQPWGHALTSLTWVHGLVTVTTTVPHGFAVGAKPLLTIANASPSGWNGAFTCTITGPSTFTYRLPVRPEAVGWPGVFLGPTDLRSHLNRWETWFENNAPATQRFIYLIDESPGTAAQTQVWAQWIATNPGPGSKIASMATLDAPLAVASTPSLTMPTSGWSAGDPAAWNTAVTQLEGRAAAGSAFVMYGGKRPGSGSFMIEDDGVALREIPWGQYKKGVSRWFAWEGTYYNDYQNNDTDATKIKDLFNNPESFGGPYGATPDPKFGQQGYHSSNGDGVLFYPGTDLLFPASSYGVNGPFASLRLKYWRRGVQDVDYLAMAAAISPSAKAQVDAIVAQTVPMVLWEFPVTDQGTAGINADGGKYTFWNWPTTVSWSDNPDDWEAQRQALATMLDDATP